MDSNERRKNILTQQPTPPPNLNKESLGVWLGWSSMGDREVAREAAAKGLHIDLAITFLSARQKKDRESTAKWFENEVLFWVDELLGRKQIYRISHILKNIGLDPLSELVKIFCSTTNKDLREYIGNHLDKLGGLDENMKHLWHLLELILRNNLVISKYKLEKSSIECLDNQSEDWKFEISAKLFLRTLDANLIPFLNPATLWNQLLLYNDIKVLKVWIHLTYAETNIETDIPETLLNILKKFQISEEMINQLTCDNISNITQNILLNDFSKFGVFSEIDCNNFLNILNRLHQSNSLMNFHNVLSKQSSNVTVTKFLSLFVDYCLEHKLYSVLNLCLEDYDDVAPIFGSKQSEHLSLMLDFRKLTSDFNETNLRDNIFKVSCFLSNNDLDSYFTNNPLIFIALTFFTKEFNFIKSLSDKSLVICEVQLYNTFLNVIKQLKLVSSVYNKRINGPRECSLTMYDLLERHLNIDVKNLYKFRFDGSEMNHFNSPNLVQTYGYSKKINYLLYVKYCRPSIASKLYVLDNLNQNNTDEIEEKTKNKIFKLALKNFNCPKISSSCIAFLGMVNINSDFLRVTVNTANILLESGYSVSKVQTIFNNIHSDAYSVRDILEAIIMEKITNSEREGSQIVPDFKTYNIVYTFSTVYNLKLPELLLRYYASNNLWLPFLILAQLKRYPIDQIKVVLQSLKNPNLLEHLHHSVIHDIQIDEQNVLMKERDSRKYFLSRIGVRQSVDSLNQMGESIYSSITSHSSVGSGNSSTGSDFLEIDILNTKTTLLQILIRCHNSTDPPRALLQACQLYRNPLLAILATSYEPDSVITNWLNWLAVSTDSCQTFTNFESVATCANSVTNLLDNSMKQRFPRTILESFEIFIPDNPLKPFIEFLNMGINLNFDLNSLKLKLESFVLLLKTSRRNSVFTEADHEMTYLTNKLWLETTALKLLASALEYNFNSLHEQIVFIDVLCKLNVAAYFMIDCPNFKNLHMILKNISSCKCDVKFKIDMLFDDKAGRQAVVDCINELLEKQLFGTALEIAQIENLPLDLILIKEWQHKFENKHSINKFWDKCNEDFVKFKITADCVIEFYLDCYEKVENSTEKYQLLKYAYEWAHKFELSNQFELEKKMWIDFLNLEDKWNHLQVDHTSTIHFLYKDALEIIKNITPNSDDEVDQQNVDELLSNILNKGNFFLALKIEKMFNCKSNDLEVLKLCYSLAEGIILPYQLNTEQRLLLTKGANFRRFSGRRTYLSTRPSSFSSGSHSPASSSFIPSSDGVERPVQDTLAILHSLSERVTSGADIAHNIFMTFRISINIEIPYHVIVANNDSMKMLKDALGDDCMNKLEVVHDFITVYKWSKVEIADFICEEIVNAASNYVKSKTDIFSLWDLNMDKEFHLVLQLLQENCSFLGYKIYSYASALHKAQILANMDFKISELSLVIELLITSHDCFTADCNMEGISTILKKCQSVISHLLTLRSWKLIVRLLTGVGRYTEMNYVFQILRENDQFEFLLRKGSRKDNGLKVALLEYLKKFCPDNRELYKIVALHFTLFSEVAQLWEREAQGIIRNLIAISKLEMQNNKLNPDTQPFVLFTNTDGTRICLNKAIENYTHATEFHLQGEKLGKAMNAAKQAELIALQMSLLKNLSNTDTAICILNLTNVQIITVLMTHLTCEQAQILVESYNHQADWASILYEHCILKNNSNYLEKFLQHLPLTETLVHDISRKFLAANINTPAELSSMKNILNKLPSVHTKYRIASELGFTDLVEDLINGGQLAYLKDTVWKKGYKSS